MIVPNFLYSCNKHFFKHYYYHRNHHSHFLTAYLYLIWCKSYQANYFSSFQSEIQSALTLYRGDFVKDGKYWGSNVQDPTWFTLEVISSEMGQRKILYKK